MFNMNDILTQLQGGQSVDEIAKSFTDALNAAIQKQNEQSEANARRRAKINDMAALIETIVDFVHEYYPEVLPEDVDLEITEAEIAELIDELDAAVPQLVQLTSALKGLEELTAKPASRAEPIGTAKMTIKRPGAKPVTFEAKDLSFGDAMEKFFKQNGLM
jgi:hypothetical protein